MINDYNIGIPFDVLGVEEIVSGSAAQTFDFPIVFEKYDQIIIDYNGYISVNGQARYLYWVVDTPGTYYGAFNFGGLSGGSDSAANGGSGSFGIIGRASWSDDAIVSGHSILNINYGSDTKFTIQGQGTGRMEKNSSNQMAGSVSSRFIPSSAPILPETLTIGVSGTGTTYYGSITILGRQRLLEGI